ncbi:MAG: VCBS repeat-containing protein [Ignavibacteria bacterium]|nr:VCBS repeat-containing protein [Ignavibacteria bacterium]
MASQIKIPVLILSALVAFLVIQSNLVLAQPFVQKFDGIPFRVDGTLSPAPFNGGMNNSRFQFVDIDTDGDKDLFTFDTDTSLYFYQNIGTAQVASFKLASNRYQGLSFQNWFYFADMDSDSDFDLFTGGIDQTVKFYKNTGSPVSAFFQLEISELRTVTDTVIYSEGNCVPTFCDMDNDGDKDFFTGQSLGTITYYENTGNPTAFSFRFITDFWQDLIIISPADDNRHGANSLEFVDIDNDLDYDLFWGDLFSKGIYFIRNDGTPTQPNVVIADSLYPTGSPYESSGYNSTRFVDIDADGDKDLFISVLYLSQNSRNFTYYRNNGTAANPQYERITDNFLNNVDVGGNSNQMFVDIDNDNDLDIFIGNDYAKLGFIRNDGTLASAQFNFLEDSLGILSTSFNYSPAFGDLDNDGDKDMLLGSYIKDSLWFFRNTGSSSSFNFAIEARGNQIGLTTLGQSSTPVLVDIDNDQDLDLFIGSTNGKNTLLRKYRNNQFIQFHLQKQFLFRD